MLKVMTFGADDMCRPGRTGVSLLSDFSVDPIFEDSISTGLRLDTCSIPAPHSIDSGQSTSAAGQRLPVLVPMPTEFNRQSYYTVTQLGGSAKFVDAVEVQATVHRGQISLSRPCFWLTVLSSMLLSNERIQIFESGHSCIPTSAGCESRPT